MSYSRKGADRHSYASPCVLGRHPRLWRPMRLWSLSPMIGTGLWFCGLWSGPTIWESDLLPRVNFSYPPVVKASVTSCLHFTHIHFLIFMFCLYSPFFAFIIKLSIIPCLHIPTDILVIPFITFPLICSVTPLLHFLSNKLDNSPPLPFRFICSVIYLLHLPTALLCNSSPSPSHWYVL